MLGVDETPCVFRQNLDIGIRDTFAGHRRRTAEINDGARFIRHAKRGHAVIGQLDFYRSVTAVVRRVVPLERDEPETRISLARLLHGQERAGANAVVLPSSANETLQRLNALFTQRLILFRATAAGLDHEIKPVKSPLCIIFRRQHFQFIFGRERELTRNRDIGIVFILENSGSDGFLNLLQRKRLGRLRRNGLGRESAKRRQRRVRVRNTRDAALVFLRRFRRASPRVNASAAGEKLLGVSGVRRVKARLRLRRLRSVRRQHGIDAAEIASGNLRLVERDNVKLLFGHELLDELRRFDTERIVAHETDDELSALPLRIVPLQLTPRQETERALEDVMVVFIAFRMDGGDEKTPFAVGARDGRRLPRHRRTLLAALRVDVAVVRRDDFNIGVLHGKRRKRNGTFRITNALSPLPDSRKLVCAAVEHNRHLCLAAAGTEPERNHAQHVGVSLRRLHK